MNATDELIDFLVENIPSDKLMAFQPSDVARRRIWTLIEKRKAHELLAEENLELEHYLRLEHLLVLAKAKASLSKR